MNCIDFAIARTVQLGFDVYEAPRYFDDYSEVCRVGPGVVLKELTHEEAEWYERYLLGKRFKHIAQVYDQFIDEKGNQYALVEYLPQQCPKDLEPIIYTLEECCSTCWLALPWRILKKALNQEQVKVARSYGLPDFIACFRRNGIYPNDVHPGNVGIKDGILKAYDVVFLHDGYDVYDSTIALFKAQEKARRELAIEF